MKKSKGMRAIVSVLFLLSGLLLLSILFLCFRVKQQETNRQQLALQEEKEAAAAEEAAGDIPESGTNPPEEGTDPPSQTEPSSQPEPVTLCFTGDILLSDGVLAAYDRDGLQGILDKTLTKELADADITMVNGEFPFSERGTKAPDKQFTFRISPSRVSIFNEIGIDIVTLANNHALDFGTEALLDTLETIKGAGILTAGAGADLDEAKAPVYVEIKSQTFAFLGASRVIPVPSWNAGANTPGMLTTYDPALLIEQIQEAKKNADTVIVYVHWGLERKEYPEEYQRNLGQMYIDAGADLVVGSHSHCLQGIEYYNGVPIVYSLGNFIFGETIEKTAILKAVVKEGEISLYAVPARAKSFRTSLLEGEDALKAYYDYYEKISYGVTFQMNGKIIGGS